MGLSSQIVRRHDHLSFSGNLKQTRYGWLRLTPAYSVHLVNDVLSSIDGADGVVLDPFCGTGTTALVCAERGIRCDTTDINPFLGWLTSAKTKSYSQIEIDLFRELSASVSSVIETNSPDDLNWIPQIHQIEKWWDEATLASLAAAMQTISSFALSGSEKVTNLLKIAFCRVMIESSNASFGHQSMSFKKQSDAPSLFPMKFLWDETADIIAHSAKNPVICEPVVILCDARDLTASLPIQNYNCVITSPPYPNRMSYIRELRPYMYWLGFLNDAQQAGDLDWQAIGGTWGSATSKVTKWVPEPPRSVPYMEFVSILERIAFHSETLSRYVHKYFYDMLFHVDSLYKVVASSGSIHYIVGNSKFYDVLLPVEEIYATIFREAGFTKVTVKTIRKRTSKRELYEYIVSATKP